MHTNEIKDCLVGREITRVEVEKDGSSMRLFIKDGNVVVLSAEGDCCSTSWIESLDAPDALLGIVQDAEGIKMPDHGNVGTERRPDVDEVKYYGLRITTNKGRCVIDYRNDSNGYYGGWLKFQE